MTRAKSFSLDQRAIPLIAPSQLQPRLYQNIQNLDVLLIGFLEIWNVANALIRLQSQKARDRDARRFEGDKDQIQTIQAHITYVKKWKYQMPVCTEDLDKEIAEVTRTFDGVEEMSVELRESIVKYIQRRDILAVLPTG